MTLNTWSPKYLIDWYFGQEKRWLDHRNKWHLIAEMNTEHAENAVKYLERTFSDIAEETDYAHICEVPLYNALLSRSEEPGW